MADPCHSMCTCTCSVPILHKVSEVFAANTSAQYLKMGRAYHTRQNNRDQKAISLLRLLCSKTLIRRNNIIILHCTSMLGIIVMDGTCIQLLKTSLGFLPCLSDAHTLLLRSGMTNRACAGKTVRRCV